MVYATKNEWQSYASVLFIGTRKWITFNRFWDYLHCYINWQAVNYRISPRHANSPEIGRMASTWLKILAKIILHLHLASGAGGFPHCKNIGGVIVSVPVGYKIGICCFSAEHAALRRKSKESKTSWLEIRIMCPSGATCLPADCCFSELVL
jgi:hypothetical protein